MGEEKNTARAAGDRCVAGTAAATGEAGEGVNARRGKMAAELLGGTVGGVLQVLVGHPLDTVKVRLQSTSYYNGMLHCIKDTARHEGLLAFYKGVGPPLMMAGILNGVLFGTNGTMKRVVAYGFNTTPDKLSTPQVLLAAVMTAPIYGAFLSPMELVKCRLQVQSSQRQKIYSGPIDVIRKIYAESGVGGIFAGYRITVLTRFVGSPFYFVSYDFVKQQLLKHNDGRQLSQMQLLTAGGVAGAMFWTGNFPVDCLRTRIQVSQGPTPPILKTAAKIIREEGVRALYRGYTACLIRSAPANAAVFYGVEMTLRVLGYRDF